MNVFRYIGWRLLAFVVLLGGSELYLRRATGFGRLVVTERSERLGWRMLPSQKRWSRAGDIPEVINSHGFRDREWREPDGDDGVLRVAIVGQSMTYGTSVASEDTWPRVLERRLAAELAGREVLVMNFAVQGYTFEQMARNYEDNVRPFRPDVLVVPLHMGDIAPMAPAQEEFDFKYRRAWFRTATRDFLFREVVDRWIPPPKRLVGVDSVNYQHILKTEPDHPIARQLWLDAMDRMNGLQESVEADGGRLAVVILPLLTHLLDPELKDPAGYWSPWAERRARARPASPRVPVILARADFGRAQGALSRKLLELYGGSTGLPRGERGVRVISADLPHAETSLFLHQDVGHYSVRGHRLLGETVFTRGAQAGLWE